jgi:hypothetical protein
MTPMAEGSIGRYRLLAGIISPKIKFGFYIYQQSARSALILGYQLSIPKHTMLNMIFTTKGAVWGRLSLPLQDRDGHCS